MTSAAGHLLLLYALTEVVACLSPGPAVLTVVSQALGGSARATAGAIVGINLGNACWYVLAGAGLTALEHMLPGLFALLRWLGIVYLLWMGIQTLRHAGEATAIGPARADRGFWRGMAAATAVQLSNPKALLFFTAILPPFIDAHRAVAPQLVALAAIGVSIEALVLTGYALLAWGVGRSSLGRSRTRSISRASGVLLITAGLGLAVGNLESARP